MASFRAFEKELGKAFTRNLDASLSAKDSGKAGAALLLMFYAVECGLKHLLCIRRRGSHMSSDDPLFWTHDLGEIVKELRLSVHALPKSFRLARGTDERGAMRDSHLAWRYGVAIQAADENKIAKWMDELAQRIRQDVY